MTNLTDLRAKNIKPKDRPLSDGTVPGLRLEPGQAKGRGKWTLRFISPVTGKRRDMGLSTYPGVSISDARKLALSARDLIRQGIDPIDDREAKKQAQRRNQKFILLKKPPRSFTRT